MQVGSQKFVLGGIKVFRGGIKSSITVLTSSLPHKKFTWPDFGRVYIPHILPVGRRYAPGAMGQRRSHVKSYKSLSCRVEMYMYRNEIT